MSAIERGLKNPFRNKVRTTVIVLLLALVLGLFAVMVQAALMSRQQLGMLEAEIRTLIELREAGAFGTGGFGGDKPPGEEAFSLDTLEKVRQIPHAHYITKIDEYIYQPQIDPTKPNAYAMLIGLKPGAALRAIGEIDYENAQIIAGRSLRDDDADRNVAIVGKLYAQQRVGISQMDDTASLTNKQIRLNDKTFQVVGIYTTGNDFGDNHVFIPLEAFRQTFQPGKKLSKIFVTVDTVAHVEQVVSELKTLPEVDAVTAVEQVSAAKTTIGGIAATTLYGAVLLFGIGGVLVIFVMVLTTKERVREIGTLKALGAPNLEIVKQFLAEVVALMLVAGVLAVGVAIISGQLLQRFFGLTMGLDRNLFLVVLLGCFAFAALGSFYPLVKATRLSPVEAMRSI